MEDSLDNSLLQFGRSHIWHPFTPLHSRSEPLCVVRAKGAYLYTHTGRCLLDGISSWWVNIHGHAHPRLAKALYEQACELEHVIFAGFTHPPALRLSRALLSALPHSYDRLFFSDNGSTAVEVALKMALQYHANQNKARHQIIAIEGAYHGDTFGAMSLGGKSLFTAPFTQHMFEVLQIPFPFPAQAAESLRLLRQGLDREPTAAFVFEPLIQGSGGMRTYAAEWLSEAIAACHDKGTLCIADEVFTGFGRTGQLFATASLSESPDLMAISKGLTGGMMPMGITACVEAVTQAFKSPEMNKTFFHGHSYTANPLACRVAEESLQILQEKETQEAIQALSAQQRAFFGEISAHPQVAHARSLGTIGALTLKSSTTTSYSNPLRTRIYDYFLERDILLRPLGNVLYVLPPYVIKKEDLRRIYLSISQFLDEL